MNAVPILDSRTRPNPRSIAAGLLLLVVLALVEFVVVAEPYTPSLGVRGAWTSGQFLLTYVLPGSPAGDAGMRPGDVVVRLDGQPVNERNTVEVDTFTDITVFSPSGKRIVASTAGANRESQRRRPTFLALAVSFLTVGIALFLLAERRLLATIILILTASASLSFLLAILTPFGQATPLAIEYIATMGFGASLLHLFLVFPSYLLSSRWGVWLSRVSLAIHAILLLAYAYTFVDNSALYSIVRMGLWLVLVIDLIGSSVLCGVGVRRESHRGGHVRRLMLFMPFTVLVSVAPFCLLSLVPPLLGMPSLVSWDLTILSIVFLPTGLAAAVLSRQFIGITRLIERSMVYVVTWSLLLLFYSALISLLHRQISDRLLGAVLVSPELEVALIGSTFALADRYLRRRIEHFLFHDIYDYASTLQTIGTEIVSFTTVAEIAHYSVKRLGSAINLSWARIVLSEREGAEDVYTWGSPTFPLAFGIALIADGKSIGQLQLGQKRSATDIQHEDVMFLQTVAPLLATALWNAVHLRALRDRERDLEALSARLIQVQEDERRRIAQDLHDDPLQRLILLARQLRNASRDEAVADYLTLLDDCIAALRAICRGIRPAELDDIGLVGGLAHLVRDVRARSDINIQLETRLEDHDLLKTLSPSLAEDLYRVAQEAVNNCLKHSEATDVVLRAACEEQAVLLTISDNGVGLAASRATAPDQMRLGILGFKERLRRWKGSVVVEDGTDGGLVVSVRVPFTAPPEHLDLVAVAEADGRV